MILDGKAVSEKRLELLKEKIEESGLYPRLATVIVGEDPASKLYVRMKHRTCERVGIGSIGIELPEDASTERVLEAVTRLNNDPDINGILVQLPLPSQVDTTRVINAVAPGKDVDGFHPYNLGRLLAGDPVFAPCTPQGIMTILEEYRIPIQGQRAVVVGRSIDVGRPMAALLLNADATVTICHSKTKKIEDEMRGADILVSAVGRLKFVRPEMVKEGATVIDVGINYDEQGKLCGDVDFEAVRERAGTITPVPGGVGPMTIATLMENTFKAARLSACCNNTVL
ncbi:bifunctional methylenetetrahydrofolate dehydrogenase/methenyltetrahydrofolate cyclohydrolase FolD [Methanoculleus bourgensis]|jgi:methylenetetrahydrofolate dehydrogenase (NADP+)/methenyltetrahydrofolate cyclohydrolase|uniref:Bifunctional protein FolD n=2 Tax=Methanoculleus bourgensis TaxID=83986 RepID=A0A0X3BIE5_9EURY|nr:MULTISPECIES: bifunctional methylenetetrahydrofolate dehydrogenase/methenyltetrahydrofolate cyclohydrolase FolD [Methanoculleus]MBT0733809.1 bifunctional methylenetetrahydrofolate dehydrogenase/methenyltetrahydrofolate cyclohydrolase FolD [Methanoculleus bourgensis]NMA88144.1 bifunctional methylenetetrahydrofolate dehydrogenase/methenyltetrahydrofolate cyclohydrolase FolD [Methanoculleus bourgensis]NQS77474.1 bifunctional methylenetetrahydrofolate dehydrogenase/methenyltetrahydrofolate cycloh